MRLKARLLCSAYLSLLFAALSVPLVTSAAASPGVVTMNTTIERTWYFDVDTGLRTTNLPTGDLWWEFVTETTRYIVPQNGALFANLGIVNFDSVVDLSAYPLSDAQINGSVGNNSIPTGTVLVVKTNLGNYAKMRIDNYSDTLSITIVYRDDGNPLVPEFPSSVVVLISLVAVTGIAALVHKQTNTPEQDWQG